MAKGIKAAVSPRQPEVSPLPDGWKMKHSISRGGRICNFNSTTGVSTWKKPGTASNEKGTLAHGEKKVTLGDKKKQSSKEMPSALSLIALHYSKQEDSMPLDSSSLSEKRKAGKTATVTSSPAKVMKSSTIAATTKISTPKCQKLSRSKSQKEQNDAKHDIIKKPIMDNLKSNNKKCLEHRSSKNDTEKSCTLLEGGKVGKETLSSKPVDAPKTAQKRKFPQNLTADEEDTVPKRKIATAHRRKKENISLKDGDQSLPQISDTASEVLANIHKEICPSIHNKNRINKSSAIASTSLDSYAIKQNSRKVYESGRAGKLVNESIISSHRKIKRMSLPAPNAKIIKQDHNSDPSSYESLFSSQPSHDNNSFNTQDNSSRRSHICPTNAHTSLLSKTINDLVVHHPKFKNGSHHINSESCQIWNDSISRSSPRYNKGGSPSSYPDPDLWPQISFNTNWHTRANDFVNSEDGNFNLTGILRNTTEYQWSPHNADIDPDIEDMEVDEDKLLLLSNLQDVRQQTSTVADEPKGVLTETISRTTPSNQPNTSNAKIDDSKPQIILVVDTNILISSLGFLRDILLHKVPGYGSIIMVLPWVVMQELDYLKNGKGSINNLSESLPKRAARAVGFIHNLLVNKSSQLVGQTPAESREETDLTVQCNDDRILQCCLQFERKYPGSQVILLTRDVNLINKAMIMGISAATNETLSSRLKALKSCFSKRQMSTEDIVSPSETANDRKISMNGSDFIHSSHPTLHAQTIDDTKTCTKDVFSDSPSVPSNHISLTAAESSIPEKHLPVDNTYLTPAKVAIEQDITPQTDAEKIIVMNKFEAVWKLIYEIKLQIGTVLAEGNSHANYNEAVQMLQVIIPLLSMLKDDYNRCLSLSPVILWEHESDFNALCTRLNTFFEQAHTSCTDPSQSVETKQLMKHFYIVGNRPTLLVGLEQLSAMVTDIEEMCKMCS